MRLINNSDVHSVVAQHILGASHSIELVANAGFGFARILTQLTPEDVFALADDRLNLRSIIGVDFSENTLWREPYNKSSFSDYVSKFASKYWQIRTTLPVPGDNVILIDDEIAIVAPPLSHEDVGRLVLVDEESELRDIKHRFESLWSTSMPLGLIYQDQQELIDPIVETQLLTLSAKTWDNIIRDLRLKPEKLFAMEPRHFEELIAELLYRQGLRVKLTPSVRDGGKDIMAFTDAALGEHLYYVECKRYSSSKLVDVGLVRQLHGVVEADSATAGILVTTSRFTMGARQFQAKATVQHRLSLKEYDDVVAWLGSVTKTI